MKYMKRTVVLLIILLVSAVGCSKNSPDKSAAIQIDNETNHVELETKDKEDMIVSINSISQPDINLKGQKWSFDHSYEEICWNNCFRSLSYNYPTIHSGQASSGDTLTISWNDMKPGPSEILLHNVTKGDSKRIDVTTKQLNLLLTEDMNFTQYALEFKWWKNGELLGNTMLNTKVEVLK